MTLRCPRSLASLWRQLYKIGLPGKAILGDYFQENRTSRRPFSLTEIQFSGKTHFYTIRPWATDSQAAVTALAALAAEASPSDAARARASDSDAVCNRNKRDIAL